jgi:hypothetical protein
MKDNRICKLVLRSEFSFFICDYGQKQKVVHDRTYEGTEKLNYVPFSAAAASSIEA